MYDPPTIYPSDDDDENDDDDDRPPPIKKSFPGKPILKNRLDSEAQKSSQIDYFREMADIHATRAAMCFYCMDEDDVNLILGMENGIMRSKARMRALESAGPTGISMPGTSRKYYNDDIAGIIESNSSSSSDDSGSTSGASSNGEYIRTNFSEDNDDDDIPPHAQPAMRERHLHKLRLPKRVPRMLVRTGLSVVPISSRQISAIARLALQRHLPMMFRKDKKTRRRHSDPSPREQLPDSAEPCQDSTDEDNVGVN